MVFETGTRVIVRDPTSPFVNWSGFILGTHPANEEFYLVDMKFETITVKGEYLEDPTKDTDWRGQ